jgi:hypothetical protein
MFWEQRHFRKRRDKALFGDPCLYGAADGYCLDLRGPDNGSILRRSLRVIGRGRRDHHHPGRRARRMQGSVYRGGVFIDMLGRWCSSRFVELSGNSGSNTVWGDNLVLPVWRVKGVQQNMSSVSCIVPMKFRLVIGIVAFPLWAPHACSSSSDCPAPNPGMCLPSYECVDGFRSTGTASCVNGEWRCDKEACDRDASVCDGSCADAGGE